MRIQRILWIGRLMVATVLLLESAHVLARWLVYRAGPTTEEMALGVGLAYIVAAFVMAL